VGVAAGRIVGGFRFVLDHAGRVAGLDQLDRFADRLDTEGKDFVKIERPGGVVRFDLNFFLQEDRSRVDALVDPKERKSGDRLAFDQCPIDRAGTAVFRQQ